MSAKTATTTAATTGSKAAPLQGSIDTTITTEANADAVKAVIQKNRERVQQYFFHKDEADRLLNEHVAETGERPQRPKGAKAGMLSEIESETIIDALNNSEALKDGKVINKTVFGNIINKALAKIDIDTKTPAKITAIAEHFAAEGVIVLEHDKSKGKGINNPAKISLPAMDEK